MIILVYRNGVVGVVRQIVLNMAVCMSVGKWFALVAHISNPDMAIEQGNYASLEKTVKALEEDVVMSPNGRYIKGYCPDGWHLPTDEEWNQLEMYLGMTRVSVDKGYPSNDGYAWGRGNGIWTKMNAASPEWNGMSSMNVSSDQGRFYGLSHGVCNAGGGSFYNFSTYAILWCSSVSGAGSWDCQLCTSYTSVARSVDSRSGGFGVRCVRD